MPDKTVFSSNNVRYAKSFAPLFSDEEIMTAFMDDLGAPKGLHFAIPQLVGLSSCHILGAIVTLKDSGSYEEERDHREAGVKVDWTQRKAQAGQPRFIPQTVDNACGVFSMLNLAINLTDVQYREGCLLRQICDSADPGAFCASSAELETLNRKHAGALDEVDDEPPAHHVAILLRTNGELWILDGDQRRRGPQLMCSLGRSMEPAQRAERLESALQASFNNMTSVMYLLTPL